MGKAYETAQLSIRQDDYNADTQSNIQLSKGSIKVFNR
jgi:hypothetical protein